MAFCQWVLTLVLPELEDLLGILALHTPEQDAVLERKDRIVVDPALTVRLDHLRPNFITDFLVLRCQTPNRPFHGDNLDSQPDLRVIIETGKHRVQIQLLLWCWIDKPLNWRNTRYEP